MKNPRRGNEQPILEAVSLKLLALLPTTWESSVTPSTDKQSSYRRTLEDPTTNQEFEIFLYRESENQYDPWERLVAIWETSTTTQIDSTELELADSDDFSIFLDYLREEAGFPLREEAQRTYPEITIGFHIPVDL
jgi:hypothetical protein